MKLSVIELFGGIGACTQALKRLGIDVDVVDYVEIDKYAVKSYNAINGTDFKPQDICEWDKDVYADLVMHGSPCQDFSVAGLGKGGDENSGTRSSLMWETVRIVEKIKPKYVVWENVKNVIGKKNRHNFDKYLSAMEGLGYTNYWQIMNAKDYGVAQNRERVFVVSVINSIHSDIFCFPACKELELSTFDFIDRNVDEKYFLSDSDMKTYNREFGSKDKIVNLNSITPTLVSSMGTGGGNVPYFHFPQRMELTNCLADYMDDDVEEKYYIKQEKADELIGKLIEDGKLPK